MSIFRLLAFVAGIGWAAGAGAQPTGAYRPVPPGAAHRSVAPATGPSIEAFDVEEVERLAPGVALRFAVYGSARAGVTLYVEGGRQLLELTETHPGIYEGSYVIDAGDAIRPGSRVVATLEQRGQVVRATLDEPLVLASAPLPWADARSAAAAPRAAQPGAAPDADDAAAGVLAVAPRASFADPPPGPARTATCADCAVVESVRTAPAPLKRGPLGAVSGAVFGALFGEQVAEEHLRRVKRVLGPLVGREDGEAMRYDVVLRLPDGSTQLRRYERPPGLQRGDAVSLSGAAAR